MGASIAALCLLLTTGTLAVPAANNVRYKREDGQFTNAPHATISAPSRMACSAKCTAMEPWFCSGFTYHNDSTCQLYRGNKEAACVNPEVVPPLEVGAGSEPPSYRLQQTSTCPGTVSEPCGCPAGFSRCAGRCLVRLNTKANHTDAVAACAALDAHLVVPRSEAEYQCAKSVAAGQVIWLGVTVTEEYTFVGADGTCGPLPASEAWWGEDQPFNNRGVWEEDCVSTARGGWTDVLCSYTYFPLCQLSSCYQPQCQ